MISPPTVKSSNTLSLPDDAALAYDVARTARGLGMLLECVAGRSKS